MLPILGSFALLTYVAIALLVLVLWRAYFSGAGIPTLVLQEWIESPDGTGDLVSIRGRRAGVVAFLLELFTIDPRVRLILRANEIELAATGLLGHAYRRIPISRVATTSAGFSRPVHWLVLGVVAIGYGVFADSRLGLYKLVIVAVGVVFLMLFALGKAAFIAVQGFAGPPLAIRYTGSVLNAKTVDTGAAQRFIRLLGDLTLEASVGRPQAGSRAGGQERRADPHFAPEPSPPPPPPPVTAYCGYCGRVGVVGEACTSCGRQVE